MLFPRIFLRVLTLWTITSFSEILAVDFPVLLSPDQRIELSFNDADGLRYRVNRDGKLFMPASRMGLELSDGTKLGQGATLLRVEHSQNDTTWQNHFGKFANIRDHYHEVKMRFRQDRPSPAPVMEFEIIIRAYNDGFAIRYVFPEPGNPGSFTVSNNLTEFLFPADYRAWIGSGADAECQYPEIRLSQMPSDRRILPLVVETPDAVAAVAESSVRDWAGSMLSAAGSPNGFGAKAALASTVQTQSPRQSPWHAVIIADDAGRLTLSTMLLNLAEPSKIADTSWIQPGISAWDVWWTGRNPYWPQHNGLYARGNTQSHQEFIDLAAEMDWPYMLIDWFWYDQDSADPETAIHPLPHIDMAYLMNYAEKRGVKLILWVNSKNVPSIGADRLLATYKEWGAAGVKIDFFPNNGSQGTEKWMEELAEVAARHQLIVDFHGVYTPTGISRTWPNVLTQEGVLAVEYVKLGHLFTPEHMIRLPFTRCLLGPADVTPGAFLNVRPEQFSPNSVPSTVIGTRARQLAFSVLVDSPYLCMADAPGNYREKAGLNFYRQLPTTWDETRVLAAGLMEHLVQARRKGNSWWIAGMNLQQARELTVHLDFLGEGTYTLTSYRDLPESNQTPSLLSEETRVVRKGDTIVVRMENTGGYAASLKPVVPRDQARVVSYNWDLYGSIPSDDQSAAGVVAAAHWNNSYPARNFPALLTNPVSGMKDHLGAASSLDFYFSHSAQWQLSPANIAPTQDDDGTFNKRLLKGYVDMANGQPLSLMLRDIPFDQYDVYVYLSCASANREGYVSDGRSTFYFQTMGSDVIAGANAQLVPAFETLDLPRNSPASYARFSGLRGTEQQITVFAQGNAGIAGFQVVEVLPDVTVDYDDWRSQMQVVGNLNDDDDGDGLQNYAEYAFGLNPKSGKSVNPIVEPIHQQTRQFRYQRRPIELTGLRYSYWYSLDLKTWTLDRAAIEGTPLNVDGHEVVSVVLSRGVGESTLDRFFVRVFVD